MWVLASLILGLTLFGQAPMAQADPIVVEYSLSGGSTEGPEAIGTVVGGTARFSFANPLSLSRASFTGGAVELISMQLVGTAGTKSLETFWPRSGTLQLNPTGQLSGVLTRYPRGGETQSGQETFYGGALAFAGNPGGANFLGVWATLSTARGDNAIGGLTTFRFSGVVGQEVLAPPAVPMTGLLWRGVLVLLLGVFGALPFAARRLRA